LKNITTKAARTVKNFKARTALFLLFNLKILLLNSQIEAISAKAIR